MKIALLCDQYPPCPHGGIGTFTHTHAHALTGTGHSVTVIGLAERDDARDDGDVHVRDIGRTRVRGIAWWRDRMRLLDAVVAGAFDVVEVPDYGGVLPRGAGDVPVVVRLHGSATACATFGARPAPRRVSWCERETVRRAVACIHPSHAALGTASMALDLGALRTKSKFIRHPVPRAPRGPLTPPDGAPDGRIVLFAGSLWGYRGVAAAATAVGRVLARHPDVHAVFVGEDGVVNGGPASVAIRGAVGVSDRERLHLTGRVSHASVARWMRAADVFLYPSEHEAFGLVLLEAMRERLPIVGSTRGACAEIVDDERTGLLVPPDDPDALANAVERLLDDGALRARMTTAALEDLGACFSAQHCATESARVYERAIAASGRRRE